MTTNADSLLSRLRAGHEQKLFLLSLSFAALLAALGFSYVVFGAFSGLLASTTDQLFTVAIGFGLIAIAAVTSYTALS